MMAPIALLPRTARMVDQEVDHRMLEAVSLRLNSLRHGRLRVLAEACKPLRHGMGSPTLLQARAGRTERHS